MTTNFGKLITVVMGSFNNWDFTKASVASFKRYYPDVRIILADGGSTDATLTSYKENGIDDIVVIVDGNSEDCRNAAAVLVDTPYILTMDNDVKVVYERALPLLYEVFEEFPDAAQTGVYCMKVADFDKRLAYCSDEFSGHMECDKTNGYFCLHKMEAWKKVYGLQKEWYYENPPYQPTKEEKNYSHGGDLTVSKCYQKIGYKIYTPKEKVPVIHWVHATPTLIGKDKNFQEWWKKTHSYIRVNPLNKWEEHYKKQTNEGKNA